MGRAGAPGPSTAQAQGQGFPCSWPLEGPLPDASSLNQRGEMMILQGTKTGAGWVHTASTRPVFLTRSAVAPGA